MSLASGAQTLAIHGAATLDDPPELVPVNGSRSPVAAVRIITQVSVGNAQTGCVQLGHNLVDELLAQGVVGTQLDSPTHQHGRVGRVIIGRAEHHQRGPPPAVQRVLCHLALARRALCIQAHHFLALFIVESLFGTDAHHGSRVRAVGSTGQHSLVLDGRPVHQPADHADVRPGQRRVVENVGILGFAAQQGVDQILPLSAQRFGRVI